MSYHIEKYPDEPIIVNTLYEDFDYVTENDPATAAEFALLEAATDPQYLIVVFYWVPDVQEMLEGSSAVARGPNAIWHHPKIKQLLIVTTSEVIKAILVGMASSEMFGNLNAKMFDSLDDALAYARQ